MTPAAGNNCSESPKHLSSRVRRLTETIQLGRRDIYFLGLPVRSVRVNASDWWRSRQKQANNRFPRILAAMPSEEFLLWKFSFSTKLTLREFRRRSHTRTRSIRGRHWTMLWTINKDRPHVFSRILISKAMEFHILVNLYFVFFFFFASTFRHRPASRLSVIWSVHDYVPKSGGGSGWAEWMWRGSRTVALSDTGCPVRKEVVASGVYSASQSKKLAVTGNFV